MRKGMKKWREERSKVKNPFELAFFWEDAAENQPIIHADVNFIGISEADS